MRRVIVSFVAPTIVECDVFVAVALPASRRCQSSSTSRRRTHRSAAQRSSASGPIERCSILRGKCGGAPSRTCGLAITSRAVGHGSNGPLMSGRTGRSRRSICTSDMFSSSGRGTAASGRCATRSLPASTSNARFSWPPSPRLALRPLRAMWSTRGGRRSSRQRRKSGVAGLCALASPRGQRRSGRERSSWSIGSRSGLPARRRRIDRARSEERTLSSARPAPQYRCHDAGCDVASGRERAYRIGRVGARHQRAALGSPCEQRPNTCAFGTRPRRTLGGRLRGRASCPGVSWEWLVRDPSAVPSAVN